MRNSSRRGPSPKQGPARDQVPRAGGGPLPRPATGPGVLAGAGSWGEGSRRSPRPGADGANPGQGRPARSLGPQPGVGTGAARHRVSTPRTPERCSRGETRRRTGVSQESPWPEAPSDCSKYLLEPPSSHRLSSAGVAAQAPASAPQWTLPGRYLFILLRLYSRCVAERVLAADPCSKVAPAGAVRWRLRGGWEGVLWVQREPLAGHPPTHPPGRSGIQQLGDRSLSLPSSSAGSVGAGWALDGCGRLAGIALHGYVPGTAQPALARLLAGCEHRGLIPALGVGSRGWGTASVATIPGRSGTWCQRDAELSVLHHLPGLKRRGAACQHRLPFLPPATVGKWLFCALPSPPVYLPAEELHPGEREGGGRGDPAACSTRCHSHDAGEATSLPSHMATRLARVEVQVSVGPGCPVPSQTPAITMPFVSWERPCGKATEQTSPCARGLPEPPHAAQGNAALALAGWGVTWPGGGTHAGSGHSPAGMLAPEPPPSPTPCPQAASVGLGRHGREDLQPRALRA